MSGKIIDARLEQEPRVKKHKVSVPELRRGRKIDFIKRALKYVKKESQKKLRKIEREAKEAEKARKREEQRRAKARQKAERDAYIDFWKSTKDEQKQRFKTAVKAKRKAEHEAFKSWVKAQNKQIKELSKDINANATDIIHALGQIKGVKITPTGKISSASNKKDDLMKLNVEYMATHQADFVRQIESSAYSNKTRYFALKYDFRDLFKEAEDQGFESLFDEAHYYEIDLLLEEFDLDLVKHDVAGARNKLNQIHDLLNDAEAFLKERGMNWDDVNNSRNSMRWYNN